MKFIYPFYLFRLIISLAVIYFFGMACSSIGITQRKEILFTMLTENSSEFGKEVNKNPYKLKRLFDLPTEFYASEEDTSKNPADNKNKKGWLGIGMKNLPKDETTPQKTSIEVSKVFPNSSAKEAGILEGDKIVALDGNSFHAGSNYSVLRKFKKSIEAKGAGSKANLEILRKESLLEIQVNLKAKPKASVNLKPGLQENRTYFQSSLLYYALKKEKLDGEFMKTTKAIRDKTANVLSLLIKNKDYNPFRLREVNSVMHYPLDLPTVAHEMTDNLSKTFNKEKKDLAQLINVGMETLDMELTGPRFFSEEKTHLAGYIAQLVEAVSLARQMREGALASLSVDDINTLYEGAINILKEDFDDEKQVEEKDEKGMEEERQQMEKSLLRFFKTALRLDLALLLTAAKNIARAIDLKSLPNLNNKLSPLQFKESWTVYEKPNLTTIQTPAGNVLIGGEGDNIYTEDATIILDLGGNDRYLNRAGGSSRENPFTIVIDFSGNDLYASSEDFSQGAGILGAGFLIDLEGNDSYVASNYSQGMGFFGAGLLVDLAGRDVYKSDSVSQGAAVFGIGILAEGTGNDDYSAKRFSQAFGFVKGYGAIVELEGADKYFASGEYPDFRDPEKSYESLSQGFGLGFRPSELSVHVSGGIGILTDAEGNDTYIGDYFAQGSSYWYALGILADKKGHDKYIAGRYSQGAGTHLTSGILMDGEGDDQYLATFGVSQGCGHDYAIGMLLDNGGNDRYISGIISQGAGNDNGIGILNDNGGDDEYHIQALGRGRGNFREDRKLGSFGLHFDTGGGTDYYSSKGKNNHLIFRTEWGIFADTK